MPIQENLNVAPYYADYTPVSDYYSIPIKADNPSAIPTGTDINMDKNKTIVTSNPIINYSLV